MQYLLNLPRSDMSVRSNESNWTGEQYLDACRADALLLAERAGLVLGAVRPNGRKK